MHVDAERVVAPGHVAERRLDQVVVRGVDHLLVLPARERVRPRRRQPVAEPVGHVEEVEPSPRHRLGRLREGLAPPGAHLDLGADQLPGHHPGERPRLRGRVEALESGDHVQAPGLEDRELLLDAHGEVLAVLEGRPGGGESLERVADLGGLTHRPWHDTRLGGAPRRARAARLSVTASVDRVQDQDCPRNAGHARDSGKPDRPRNGPTPPPGKGSARGAEIAMTISTACATG